MPLSRAMVGYSRTPQGCEQGSTWLLGSGEKTRRLPATHTADTPASSLPSHVANPAKSGLDHLFLPKTWTYDLKGWATAPEALFTLENTGKLGAIHIFF